LKAVSDDKLLHGLFEILKRTRHDEADLVAHIAEVDGRKLYAREASPSIFAWCTESLRLEQYRGELLSFWLWPLIRPRRRSSASRKRWEGSCRRMTLL
jgi:hypothetical protein